MDVAGPRDLVSGHGREVGAVWVGYGVSVVEDGVGDHATRIGRGRGVQSCAVNSRSLVYICVGDYGAALGVCLEITDEIRRRGIWSSRLVG